MPISNGLALPNPLSNGTTADAVPVMADFNYLLSALNRALIDTGGGAGMNAQSTQIHNLASGTVSTDAVNLGQLNGFASLSGATFTGGISGTTLSLSSTLSVSGASTLAGVTASTLTLSGLLRTVASAAGGAGLNIPHGAAPSVPNNGDFWTTTAGVFAFINGATQGPFSVGATPANPTGTIGLAAVNGAATTYMRSDAAPPLSQSIVPTWTGLHTFNAGFSSSAAITLTGALTTGSAANSVGYLGAPQNLQTASYTLALSDMGKSVDMNGASLTLTVPANASVAFPVGTVIPFSNLNSTALSVAITTDTMTLAGTATTGTRTVAQNGAGFLKKVGATSWIIGGQGVT